MTTDPRTLQNAADLLEMLLRAEADAQNACLPRFVAGGTGRKVKRIDLNDLALKVITAGIACSRRP
jgi:hypothetical protein